MAALCEELTLCGLTVSGVSSLQGVEAAGDDDRVLVTEAGRTVTLYKVSDQRPLGSWSVKQGQRVTCPAVYNSTTEECVVVHDDKVLRIWKKEDVRLDKVFKTTLSAEVCRIHSLPGAEPLVLFRRGAVRYLDTLLPDPRQEIENVLTQEEAIIWSQMFVEDGQPLVMFITEKVPDLYVNVWKARFRVPLRYKLQAIQEESHVLNFTANVKKNAASLLILYSTGKVRQSLVPLVESSDRSEIVLSLSSLLQLSEPVDSGAMTLLDDSHLATLTPSATKQKDLLCIWNVSFQTMQECKEFSQRTTHQLWNYHNTLYVPRGSKLRVLRYICEPSSLASALGKAADSHRSALNSVPIVSWGTVTESKTTPGKRSKKADSAPSHLTDDVSVQSRRGEDSGDGGCAFEVSLSDLQSASEMEISALVRKAMSSLTLPEFQITAGKMGQALVDRCRRDPKFNPQSALITLIETRKLSYSLCPDLMPFGLERSDVRLLQCCLRRFIDVPEAVMCSCLKMFLSTGDDILCDAILKTASAESYIEVEEEASDIADNPKEPPAGSVIQNGFSPGGAEDDSCDIQTPNRAAQKAEKKTACPVSLKRAVLLNTIVTAAYSESCLLPHLKDLTSDQVLLFLSYLLFLYKICNQQLTLSLPGKEKLSVTQVIDWMNLLLDANFTVLVVLPKAKPLIRYLQKCVHYQMKLYSELNKIEGSLCELKRLQRPCEDNGRYSIEVLELY
ncbi:PREDICTED: nucleolar protein 11 [Nanorana parkeri]|uniref:nucleolar protein 11 n=1 Tax=Nanorana parkeri TaxID=125878 RepID=UPI0008545A5E|nr:PREDICTED: nucleolar protein 11 [Nanorana parkeri]